MPERSTAFALVTVASEELNARPVTYTLCVLGLLIAAIVAFTRARVIVRKRSGRRGWFRM